MSLSNVIKRKKPVRRVQVVAPLLNKNLRTSASVKKEKEAVFDVAGGTETSWPLHAQEEYDRGFREGYAKAEDELRRQYAHEVEQERQKIDRLVVALDGQLGRILRAAEQRVVRFALFAAALIVKREVKCDNEIAERQIREGLKRVAGIESVRVRVHPLDEPMVRERRAALLSTLSSLREIVVVPDEAIERGGCILETENGNVDARLSTQMEKIESVLLDQATEAA